MKIKIKRQDGPGLKWYWQIFDYEASGKNTVAGILDNLNSRKELRDEKGNSTRRIKWECGCMQEMCGACAMIINNVPALACGTFIDTDKTEQLVLEPLSKFPVINDLCVDRTCIQEYLKEAEIYLGKLAETDPKEFKFQYQAAKCLKCGLCLEACPNYTGKGNFFGAVFVNEAYLECSSSEDRKEAIKQEYHKHFENGCSKSLACVSICPMKIPTLAAIGYLNKKHC